MRSDSPGKEDDDEAVNWQSLVAAAPSAMPLPNGRLQGDELNDYFLRLSLWRLNSLNAFLEREGSDLALSAIAKQVSQMVRRIVCTVILCPYILI